MNVRGRMQVPLSGALGKMGSDIRCGFLHSDGCEEICSVVHGLPR
jgi:hypothetical protein